MSKIIGGGMMVAGTSIGAAMIGMPIQAGQIGWFYSVVILILVSSVMLYMANLVSEIYSTLQTDSTISKIAGEVLGAGWQILCSGATLMLMYSLLIAYLSGVSEMIGDAVKMDRKIIALVSTVLLLVSLSISNSVFDYYNRAAFSLKIVFMLIMTVLLMPHVNISVIAESSSEVPNPFNILSLLPLFVTSFGFHAGIPFVFKHLDGDVRNYKKAVFYGVSSTLVIYVVWLTMCLGTININHSSDATLSSFVQSLTTITQSPTLNLAIKFFMTLAILTSLFGVATTLFDFIHEFMTDRVLSMSSNRFTVSAIVFIPPLIFSLIDNSLFIKALGVAGIALTIIAVFIPAAICLKIQTVKYNKILLLLSILLGLLTVVGEIILL